MSSPDTLPRYRLAAPTEEEAVEILHRLLGPRMGEEVWRCARSACGAADGEPLTLEQLQSIADAYVDRTGSEGVFGRSLAIRIRTYVLLRDKLTRVA